MKTMVLAGVFVLAGLVSGCDSGTATKQAEIQSKTSGASAAIAPQSDEERIIAIASRGVSASAVTVAKIERLPDGSKGVLLKYAPKQIWDGKAVVFAVSDLLVRVGKESESQALGIGEIAVNAWIPTVDKYGNPGVGDAFTLVVPRNEYAKIHWGGIAAWDLLNLTSESGMSPLGRDAIAEYCADTDNFKYARRFCTTGPSAMAAASGEDAEVLESATRLATAEAELNRAWKSLPKEKRQVLLQEQRDFNKSKESDCERVALAAGNRAPVARNDCWTSRYAERTAILLEEARKPVQPASELFGGN